MKFYKNFFWCLLFSVSLLTNHSFGIDLHKASLRQLDGKKIAYFNGSFDPFHKGHEAVVNALKNHADFILIYVNDGQSSRKPNRLPKKFRQQMVNDLYHDDPLVLTTSHDGYTLQSLLGSLKDTEFVAAVGADVIDEMKDHPDVDKIYHRGTKLLPHEGRTSKAAMFVIKTEKFLAFQRDGKKLPKKLFDRNIVAVDIKTPNISATQIRENLRKNNVISHLVSKPVENIIRENNLYLK
jgi:cytidyltransferase-like protein